VKNFYAGFQPPVAPADGNSLAQTAANLQKARVDALERQENSFTRKLKENKEAYKKAALQKGKTPI
jgi:hypothetical protein